MPGFPSATQYSLCQRSSTSVRERQLPAWDKASPAASVLGLSGTEAPMVSSGPALWPLSYSVSA